MGPGGPEAHAGVAHGSPQGLGALLRAPGPWAQRGRAGPCAVALALAAEGCSRTDGPGAPQARRLGPVAARSPSSCRPFRVGGEKVILLSASAWGFITAATPLLTHLGGAHLLFMTFSRILTGLLQGRAPWPSAGVCACTRVLACVCSCRGALSIRVLV